MRRPASRLPATGRDMQDPASDGRACAEFAGLRYISVQGDGIARRRCGRGFVYRQPSGKPVSAAERERITALAIPPAWRDVWICTDPDGHIQATGLDDRGRRQYQYHERWRAARDEMNFARLATVGAELPAVRAHVARQLRRRTLDRDQAIAAMIRIADRTGMRIGSETYAEENHTHGLTTLMPRHVRVEGRRVEFDFPAKGGRRTRCTIEDAPVARIVAGLAAARRRRLFVVDREPVDAESVNESLAEMSVQHITAKDLRTWHGTRAAFRSLLAQRDDSDADAVALQAIDAAAEALANTRAVARAHYVHPRLLDLVSNGTFEELLRRVRPFRANYLTRDERLLIAVLEAVSC